MNNYQLRTSIRKRATTNTEDDLKAQPPIKEIKMEEVWEAVPDVTPEVEAPLPDSMDTSSNCDLPAWIDEATPIIQSATASEVPQVLQSMESALPPTQNESIEEAFAGTFQIMRENTHIEYLKNLNHYMTFLPRTIMNIHHRLINLNAEFEQLKQVYIQEKEAETANGCAFDVLKLYLEHGAIAAPTIPFEELVDTMLKQQPAKRAMEERRLQLELMEHEIRTLQCQLSQGMGSYACCADFTNKVMKQACTLQENIYKFIEELKLNM